MVYNESLLATARYIEIESVHARLVRNPQDYEWSSAGAHIDGRPDCLARGGPFPGLADEWKAFLLLSG